MKPVIVNSIWNHTRATLRNFGLRNGPTVTRPAGSTERLSLTTHGHILYRLKTPYRDGTRHVVFEPLDFIARLAALVPNPRVNLTRYHGVFAPNHHLRKQVTPARRGRRHAVSADEPPATRHAAMSVKHNA